MRSWIGKYIGESIVQDFCDHLFLAPPTNFVRWDCGYIGGKKSH